MDELVPAADGQVAAEIDGELFSVQHCIRGSVYPSPRDLTGARITNMMKFLAHYHSASGRYRDDGKLAAWDDTLPVRYTEDPERLRERLKNLPTTDPAVESAVNHAIDRAGSFFASGSYSKLKRTWIHGDFRCCNVAFDADGVSGLFDWDLLCSGPRLFDVVVASADLARTNAGPLSSNPEMWQEDFRRHLAAYRKEARRRGDDMTESEVRSIPYMLLADAVLSGVFFALHLRQLPLKPGESTSQRLRRSDRLLSESLADVITIDSLIANGSTLISPHP